MILSTMADATEKTIEEIWNQAVSNIKESMDQSEFSIWFSRVTLCGEKNGCLMLAVPSTFIKDTFVSKYKALIEKTLSDCGKPITVDFTVKKQEKQTQTKDKVIETTAIKTVNPTLNPAYTFDAFVPGDNSNFAFNACLAISKNPGATYNPCLLYGGVGLGKTHLLQSIGNAICAENPKAKVMYVTAENFLNEFLTAIREKTTHKFQNKYRNVSVLLIDDIQLFQGMNAVQTELFNTFNDLYDSGRQIVFTCDRPVEDLKDITDRLRSRFSRGLNIDIQPPDYETRLAIIQKKCMSQGFMLGDDIMAYIAENISSNVRMLESCITKLKAYSDLLSQDITLETAKNLLRQNVFSSNDTSGLKMENIIKTVASYFGVTLADLKSKGRSQSIVLPRQIAMYICSKLTNNATTQIAQEFGGKNHTTVMYNVQKVESMMRSSENDISNIVNKLINQIKEENKKP